jgi:hypothetical protein
MNRNLAIAAFALGAGAVLWVAAGYAVSSQPLALVMTAAIALAYLVGAWELRRFHQATAGLRQALATLPADLPRLDDWLARLPPALQAPVRQRVEGARVPLPGPNLTPTLVGLLVMLGMLGTFLGMVVTLNGAVLALESTTDLATIRAALSAPVKGLGLAFGTSVAGVAASAMLGLMSAACRRDRLQAAQALDTCMAGPLRRFTESHRRDELAQALQSQARVVPDTVAQLQATMQAFITHLERQSQVQGDRLLASQEAFFQHSQSVVGGLVTSVDQTLQRSLAETARLTGATLQPLAETTLAGLAREASQLHERVAARLAQQLDGVSTRLDQSVGALESTWTAALDRHQQAGDAQARHLGQTLDGFAEGFEQRTASLLTRVDQAQAMAQSTLADTWRQALAEHQRTSAEATGNVQQALAAFAETQARQSTALIDSVQQATVTLSATHAQQAAALVETQARQSAALLETAGQQSAALLETAARQSAALREDTARQSAELLMRLESAQAALQADLAVRDDARQAAMAQALQAQATALAQQWSALGAATAEHQQRICRTLEDTARQMHAQAESHARATIGEIAQLTHTAAEAPRLAAELMGQLRQQLSDSLVRDTQLLDERQRLMDTLRTLLDAIQHAASEQRSAIDALVESSAALLQRVGGALAERVGTETSRLADVAAQVAGSAQEVGSLGEAFGAGVQRFGDASEALISTLQRIEASLTQTSARSDEQLAYYVAQAREIIDLSMLSQQQIVEDLQRLQRRPMSLAEPG